MQKLHFAVKTHGKCIIAGEHAVLRGHPGIIFPVKSKNFTLTFKLSSTPLNLDFNASCDEKLIFAFWSIIKLAGEHARPRKLPSLNSKE